MILSIIIWIAIISAIIGFIAWAFGGSFSDNMRNSAGCMFSCLWEIITGIAAIIGIILFFCYLSSEGII